MARKTFISYKYSESRETRDQIIKALGIDARYYKGETSDSPDRTDTNTETIKHHLKKMIYDTTVTIVIISPNMKQSKWISWEIEYSLKEVSREDKTSKSNGIVGVIQKNYGGYDWILNTSTNVDGCSVRNIDNNKLYDIISKNRFNLKTPIYSCEHCQTVDALSGSYISLITEEIFLSNPNKYIENAYDKSKKIDDFNLVKTLKV